MTLSPEFRALLETQKQNAIIPRMSKISTELSSSILIDIQKKYNLEKNYEALTVIALLAQQGGTAKGCDGNLTVNIFQKDFKLSEIRKIIASVSKQTLRKVARTFADEIFDICTVFEIPGNLHKKIIRLHPERQFMTKELIWLSDFQSENQNCPNELRQFIIEAFNFRQSFINKPRKTGK